MLRTFKSAKRNLGVEPLEPRTMLSGVVQVEHSKGVLSISGGDGPNQVAVGIDHGEVRIEGIGDTLVEGVAAVKLPSIQSVQISGGGGDDVFDIDPQLPGVVVDGGDGFDIVQSRDDPARLFELINVEAAQLSELEQPGAMQIKLDQAIELLTTPDLGVEVSLAAQAEMMDALFTSALVPLPTPNADPNDPNDPTAEATAESFAQHNENSDRAIQALTQHINDRQLGTPVTKATAIEARNFLQVTQEAMQVIADQTRQCNPNQLQDPTGACLLLAQDDESGIVVDTVLQDAFFSRQVRNPGLIFGIAPQGPIQEQILVSNALGPDECSSIIKEIQGIKAVVTARPIPIWVEPWNARRRIVGFRRVWVWEFVPAEHIKDITMCNVPKNPQDPSAGRTIRVDVDTRIVLERGLLHFWRFLNKDITIAGQSSSGSPSTGGAQGAPQPAQVPRLAGDANGDGLFNRLDIIQVLQAGKYSTGQSASFQEGDWNEDGVFNQLDLVKVLQEGNYQP